MENQAGIDFRFGGETCIPQIKRTPRTSFVEEGESVTNQVSPDNVVYGTDVPDRSVQRDAFVKRDLIRRFRE